MGSERDPATFGRRLAEDGADPVYWVIDETSFPKAGAHSVGVARQYCGALGKIANCQAAVSLHWSQSEVSYPTSWRLFLPEDWIKDAARRQEARVPVETVHRTKQELALELIAQAGQWSLPAGTVLADSAYGNDFDLGADVNAALNILAAGLAVSARGGSGITPAREPRTQPRDRPLHAGSTGIPVKMTFVV